MATLYPTECICAQGKYIKTIPWVEFIIDSAGEASTHQHWLYLEKEKHRNTKATTLKLIHHNSACDQNSFISSVYNIPEELAVATRIYWINCWKVFSF